MKIINTKYKLHKYNEKLKQNANIEREWKIPFKC